MKVLREKNIIHRDLKPENMVLHVDTANAPSNALHIAPTLKIADFGLSKYLSEESGANPVLGTVEYMAPEMLRIKFGMSGNYTAKVDLWSIGVILFECLTGSVPFKV